MHIYALLDDQGTACSETVLLRDEYNDVNRAAAETAAAKDDSPNAPVPGTWTDVSDNEHIIRGLRENLWNLGWHRSADEAPDSEIPGLYAQALKENA